jgi:hypothetical protein
LVLPGTHSGTARPAVRGGFGIYDTLPLTYQFELLAINDAPYFQTGSITTLPQGSFPTGALPLLTANNLGYAWCNRIRSAPMWRSGI